MDNDHICWPGWETVRLIGRGSFGSVYEIQRVVFGNLEKAALKVISIPQNESDIEELYNDGYDSESITSTFQSHLKSIVAEYSLMRKMNGCGNIVQCDDVRYVQHDDGIGWDIFIKMELLTPLNKALSAENAEEEAEKLAKDLCKALVVCSENKIVHRDIKPQNIFVSKYGDYKLGDFGIAKTVERTTGGTKIGTYKYMAPEVYNNKPYGTAADIYSLGLVLYWMLNERRMPFMPLPPEKLKAGTEEATRKRRLSGEPLPPPAHGREVFKCIVMKACAYDIKNRYQSANEMLDDLLANEEVPPQQLPQTLTDKYCASCGAVLEQGNRFCIICGLQLEPMVESFVPEAETVSVEQSQIVKMEEMVPETPQEEEQVQTKECFYCGAALELNARFCIICGRLQEMEICAYCGELQMPPALFCTMCGERMVKVRPTACVYCGAALEPGARFCTQCGKVV